MAVILASQSPRRRELLERMGISDFLIRPAQGEEIFDQSLTPAQLVEALSRQKAEEIAAGAGPEDIVIAADTVVSVDGRVLGKPGDEAEAAEMLAALSGREHTVYTGVTVRRGGETVTEPVAPGTNRASVESSEVDVLAHPGFITLEEAQIAKDNGVLLEVSGRAGHNITNGHVVNMARAVGADMVVDSDTHAPENLMDDAAARTVAFGAGMTKEEAEKALYVTPYEAVRHIA